MSEPATDIFDQIATPLRPEMRKALRESLSRRNIGRAIVHARLSREITQAELAGRAGTTQSRISAIEALDCNARLDTLDHIARALGYMLTMVPAHDATIDRLEVATSRRASPTSESPER